MSVETSRWDRAWAAADLPDHEREAWRALMSYRTNQPTDAVRLSTQGWTPDDVELAWEDSRIYRELDYTKADPVAAAAVLAHEAASRHIFYAGVATSVRGEHVRGLAERRASDRNWTFDRIAALLGITKQRAREIAQRGPGAGR
jgi:hypothetical protein